MTTLDIIRLATERAEVTGDIDRPEFHDAIARVANAPCTESQMEPQIAIGELARSSAAALRESAKAQLEFRALLSTLTAQHSPQ